LDGTEERSLEASLGVTGGMVSSIGPACMVGFRRQRLREMSVKTAQIGRLAVQHNGWMIE